MRCIDLHTSREYLRGQEGRGDQIKLLKSGQLGEDEGVTELGVLLVDCLKYFQYFRLEML